MQRSEGDASNFETHLINHILREVLTTERLERNEKNVLKG